MNATEIHYKVGWRASRNFPGFHSSPHKGSGFQFRNHASLIAAPDPRRFDVRATLRDPFGQVQVRVYHQTSSIPVYIVADLSASMGFAGAISKMRVISEFVAALSHSAYKIGDRFGFVGCSEAAAEPLFLPPTMNRAAGLELAEQLASYAPKGSDCAGLVGAADLLGTHRSLVFLISDFHYQTGLIEQINRALAYHDVVPVVLWDRHEHENLPRFGLARIYDPETRGHRLLLMRGKIRQQIEQAFVERETRLTQLFSRYGRVPLMFHDGFDADEVSRYFFG